MKNAMQRGGGVCGRILVGNAYDGGIDSGKPKIIIGNIAHEQCVKIDELSQVRINRSAMARRLVGPFGKQYSGQDAANSDLLPPFSTKASKNTEI